MFDFLNGIGEKTIERMFLNLIRDFTPETLKEAVREDLSLLDQTAMYNPRMLAVAERLSKRFWGQRQHLTYENVVRWVSDKRPDFYQGIRFDLKAQDWLRRQIEEFRVFLFDY